MSRSQVGICRGCGAMRAAMVLESREKKDHARFVAELARNGLQITEMDSADVRAANWKCACEPEDPAENQLELLSGPHP